MSARRALAGVAACALGSGTVAAQQPTWSTCRDSVAGKACGAKGLSRREREQAQSLYNAPATRRETAPFTLARDSVIRGSLAVIGGPVRIAGTIDGALLVIDGDVEFTPTATVTGVVAVLGGRVTGTDSARIGALRVDTDSVRYGLDAGRLDAEPLRVHGQRDDAVFVRRFHGVLALEGKAFSRS